MAEYITYYAQIQASQRPNNTQSLKLELANVECWEFNGKKNDSRKKYFKKNLFSAPKIVFVFILACMIGTGNLCFSCLKIHITAVSVAEVNPLKNLFHCLEPNVSSWKWITSCPYTSPLGYWPIKIKSDRKDDFIRGTMLFRDKTGKSKDTRFSEEMYHCS